jgi:hypothetical protein
VKAEVLLGPRRIEIWWQAHVDGHGRPPVGVKVSGVRDISNAGDLFGTEPARRVIGLAGCGHFDRGDADGGAFEKVALQSEGKRGSEHVGGGVAGEDEDPGVGVRGVRPHGDGRARDSFHLE